MLDDRLELDRKVLQKYSESKLLTVDLTTSLLSAIALMNQHRSSYLLIESQRKLEGIFTERDLVQLIAAEIEFGNKTIGEVMTKQPKVLSSWDNFTPLELINLFQQHQVRHLPLIDSQGKAVGIFTHDSLLATIQGSYLLRRKKVREIMNHQVISTTGDRKLIEVARLLATHRVSCVVIVESSTEGKLDPVGIVTERDLVQIKALNLDFNRLAVRQVMSSPLSSIHADATLENVRDIMLQQHIRRLVAIDKQGFLTGIVTQTNILRSINIREVYAIQEFLEDVVEKQSKQLEEKKEIETAQQEQLQLNQNYLNSVLADTTDIVLIINPHTQQVSLLSAELDNGDRQRHDLITETKKQFCQPKTSQTFFAVAQQAIQTQQKISFEYSIFLADKGQFSFSARVSALPDNTAIWVARDITQIEPKETDFLKANTNLEKQIAEKERELKTANRLLKRHLFHLSKRSQPIISNRTKFVVAIFVTRR